MACSRFKEKFEEENGAEQRASFPIASSLGSTEHTAAEVVVVESTGKENEPQVQAHQSHQMCSDINTSQEFVGGMMKIVPSNVDVSIILITLILMSDNQKR